MDYKKEIMFDFTEWVGTSFIRLYDVWVGKYHDQMNRKNWRTTEELFQYWLTNIKEKENEKV